MSAKTVIYVAVAAGLGYLAWRKWGGAAKFDSGARPVVASPTKVVTTTSPGVNDTREKALGAMAIM